MKKEYQYCLRCNKILKTYESKLRGYGPNCFRKIKKENKNIPLIGDNIYEKSKQFTNNSNESL